MIDDVSIDTLPTPALIVDVPAMERNIRRMAEFFRDTSCKLRPHFKAHKTPEIAKRQLAAGSCTGLTCATVSEAEVAAEFCDDVLLANEAIGPGKCERLAALARRIQMTVAVDSLPGVEALDRAGKAAGVSIGAVVDLDVGQRRCGVQPGKEAVTLARRVAASGHLVLRGVMGYEGHLLALEDRRERETRTRAAMERLAETARLIQADGLRCDLVSCGGTGTYDISGKVNGITEVQAGSYVLMDSDYGRLDLPFEQAFWVLGTIVSRPEPTRCVADAGHKSQTKDHGLPSTPDIPGAEVVSLYDEHATIRIPADSPVSVGDRVRLRPSHTDPTMNLHDVIYALEGGRVIGVWPIAARGYRPST
jgi:D-serine deaminase-like pyridoxal phosphate-dependent protein